MSNHGAPAASRPKPTPASRIRGRGAATPLWILALIALAFFLRETRGIFVPVALAVLASYPLDPVARGLARLGIPRPVGAAIVVVLIAAAAGWTGWALKDDFERGTRNLPAQIRQIRLSLREQTEGGIFQRLREAAEEAQKTAVAATQPGTSESDTETAPQPAPPPEEGSLASYLNQGSMGLVTIVSQITVIVFLVYFLLVGAEAWRTRLVRLAGSVLSSRRAGTEVIGDIHGQIQRFVIVRVLTSAGVAAATWLALLAFGAPAPALWGVAAGVFNAVPYFGPIIVSSGLAIVGFVSGGFTMALELAGVALAITTLEGWLITPPLLGHAAEMNTLSIFISLLFWSWVWGIWGTILAVPLMAIVKSISDHVEPLGWLSLLLGAGDGADSGGTRRR